MTSAKLSKRWGPHNPGTVITTDPAEADKTTGAVLVNSQRFEILTKAGHFAPPAAPPSTATKPAPGKPPAATTTAANSANSPAPPTPPTPAPPTPKPVEKKEGKADAE